MCVCVCALHVHPGETHGWHLSNSNVRGSSRVFTPCYIHSSSSSGRFLRRVAWRKAASRGISRETYPSYNFNPGRRLQPHLNRKYRAHLRRDVARAKLRWCGFSPQTPLRPLFLLPSTNCAGCRRQPPIRHHNWQKDAGGQLKPHSVHSLATISHSEKNLCQG